MSQRTTLTLDDDVVAKVASEARRSGGSYKETVNRLLRLGLTAAREPGPREPFRVKARSLGLRPGFDLDNIEELLDQVEGPLRR